MLMMFESLLRQDDRAAAFRNNCMAALIILAAVTLTYWGSITGEFVVDDKVWAALPKAEDPFRKISLIFTSWGFSLTSLQVNGPPQYRPLGSLILMLFHDLFGPNPVAYHLFSLFSHYINSMLVFVLLNRLLPALPIPYRILSALAFALHPALTEAVAWITSIVELQMTTCVLLAMISYLNWKNTRRNRWILAAAVCALAGVMIKEGALAFVLLILVFDWCQERKIEWRALSVVCAGTILYFVSRLLTVGSVAGGKRLTFSATKLTGFLLAHLRYLFIPGQQPFSIDPAEEPVAGVVAILATCILLLLLFWWGYRQTEKIRGTLCFGGLWIFITLWPTYAIALVGSGYFAGRHIYLPAVGWVLILGVVLTEASFKIPYLKYVAAGGVFVMALLSARATNTWHTNVAVYQQSTKLSPNFEGSLAGFANALFEAGSRDQAMAAYKQLLERSPNSESSKSYLYRLAIICSETGRIQQSNEYLNEILRQSPDYAAAWVGLGNNSWLSGQMKVAFEYYQKALKLEPGNIEARRNSAQLAELMGNNPMR
jgi:protein O-mannosyl-transferase